MPPAVSRHGRIRRHGLCRLPGPATAGSGRSRGNSKPRWPASAMGCATRSTGPAARTPASTRGAGDRLHLRRTGWTPRTLEAALNGRLPPDIAVREVRPVRAGVPSPSRGAVPGVPLHRLERAAQSASRASCARGPGPARRRRDGASRAGLRRPARLQRLRDGGRGPHAGPDRARGPGPEAGIARDDRRPGRRLPPGHGPPDGGRPPRGRPRKDERRRRSGRRSPPGRRPATGQPPRPAGSVSGASSSDGGRSRNDDRRRRLRNDEHEDLRGPRERDRAALVRRRRGGRDARPRSRRASRACSRASTSRRTRRTSIRATT